MLIDFHTHAFPDALAERALGSLKKNICREPLTDGTVSGLLEVSRSQGCSACVICNVATNPKQVSNVNSFAISTAENYAGQAFPLGSIHPDFSSPEDEIERLYRAGIKGIKLHPDYMNCAVDDKRFDSVFSFAAERGMFVLVHAGLDACVTSRIMANPDEILRRIDRTPNVRLVCAHLGGNMMWNEVMDKLVGKNIWLDTALLPIMHMPADTARKILTAHGSDMILFGTDSPWSGIAETRDIIESLSLPWSLREKLYHANAEALLGIQ